MQQKPAKVTNISKSESQKTFVENQNNCPLCCSELVIEIEVCREDMSLKEQAKCPQCDLLARVKDHNLQ